MNDSGERQGWTVETSHAELLRLIGGLEQQLQQRFDAAQQALADALVCADQLRVESDRRYEERFVAQEKAVLKAEGSSERRFDAVNSFRAQLSDQAATFIPRVEAEQRIGVAVQALQALQASASSQITREELDRLSGVYNDKIDVLGSRLGELALDGRGYATRNELATFRDQLSEARESMMPRQEVKLLVDTVGTQVGAAQRTIAELSNVVIQLRATLQGQGSGADAAAEAQDRRDEAIARTRTYVFAVIGAVGLVVSLFLGFRSTHSNTTNNNVVPSTPAATVPATTTTVPVR